MAKSISVKITVECMECGKKFRTSKVIPECPKCGGADIDLPTAEPRMSFNALAATLAITRKG